ncbi:MAG TPA: EF-P lysine aminoacylase EpmA [Myxococcota bacterium]|jgi:lysyl-tRNA synthetase class 2
MALHLRTRSDALFAVRAFLKARGFLEVDTPLLVPGPGLEPHIDPLSSSVRTDFNAAPVERFLITSPELALKRLLAAGNERIFQLGHVFRDGERTKRHLPEFTLLEWYRAGGTLDDLVNDHEQMFAAVAEALKVNAPAVPFQRAEVADLFEEHAGIDLDSALTAEGLAAGELVARARAAGIALRPGADFDDAFFAIMGDKVEPQIGRERPVVVSRWPASMAVLANLCEDDPRYALRFEVYASGLELSNAYDELTDATVQRARFADDNAKRRALGKRELPVDEDFLAALPRMPKSAGVALGFDRLLMLLLRIDAIDEVTPLAWR